MVTLKRSKPVAEQKAVGGTERLFHEIKQTLRVTGVNLNFRTYAAYELFFPAMWEAMGPNVETRAFEEAADRLREESVHAADGMMRLSALGQAQLGESQAFQAERALLLYHYVNPKLLVFTSALTLAFEKGEPGGRLAQPAGSAERIERGAPARMPAMEMVEEGATDHAVRRIFSDIRRSLGLEQPPCDYRALALWPRYLVAGWQLLKPVLLSEGYQTTCRRLGELSRQLARTLPYPAALSREALAREGENVDAVIDQTRRFERALPGLLLNISLLVLDWQAPELARRSPYPARPRPAGEQR